MEDHLKTILYLVVGVIYFLLTNTRSRKAEQQPAEDMPEDLLSPSAPATDRVDVGEEAVQKAPATTLDPQATVTKASPTPVYPKPYNTPQATLQKQPQPPIKRVLSRYSGWKKAMIMHELIRPHTYIA